VEDGQPKTLNVPDAGRRYFGLGRNASYEAAKRGELPVVKIGARLRVPVIALERMLVEAGKPARQPTQQQEPPIAANTPRRPGRSAGPSGPLLGKEAPSNRAARRAGALSTRRT
jgi:hypothetical protein